MEIDNVEVWYLRCGGPRPSLQIGQVQRRRLRALVVDRPTFGDPLSKRPCARHVHVK
jgi:hypothetical protein